MWSLSYSNTVRWPTLAASLATYDEVPTHTELHNMNTIIYIVGLIVVIGFVLSFFGLR